MFKAAAAFLIVAIIAGLFAFGIIPTQNMHEARIVFFACATLVVPCLLVALVREE